MKRTYINGQFCYQDEKGIRLPSVTTILKATQPIESVAALSNWRNKVGNTEANRMASMGRRRGKLLHQWVKDYLQGLSPVADSSIQPYCYSLKSVLEKLSDVQLIETVVPNYVEGYAGKVDLVARYQDVPCIIELTTAEQPKQQIRKLYDKPLQLVAYGGAINRYYRDSLFGSKIVNGLIIVALRDQDAEEFMIEREQLIIYWQEWLQRLEKYVKKAA
ncbi:exonuclease [Planktothrix sp. FACHB-1365]|uniref:exonuclease n=1 Tax=Planktothrix sp. FACHB-1365 TaxID=2692855 RepID=UPI0016881A55|nr:exonuclease [Planktothrix sp. FACHB-1365]MBD2480526.1 exonuclease [Planktothrix sp. FACHB-1365]